MFRDILWHAQVRRQRYLDFDEWFRLFKGGGQVLLNVGKFVVRLLRIAGAE